MPDAPATRPSEIALLRAAIQHSGLSLTEYARTVLVRDPRTLRRWLSGDRQIPQAVLDRLTAAEEVRAVLERDHGQATP